MNLLAIAGIILLVFGVLVLVFDNTLQFVVGIAFLLIGGYLAGKGFGLINV